jgi:hypothetical protein
VIVAEEDRQILGAQIVETRASLLIRKIINLMHADCRSVEQLNDGLDIHPAMPVVVHRAFRWFMRPEDYHRLENRVASHRCGPETLPSYA